MFIAIENMASAYGYKKKNTANKAVTTYRSRGAQKSAENANAAKYEARQKLATAVGFNPKVDESEQDFLFTARMFAEKRKERCRYGISGSLRSMFKRMAFECENTKGLKFDTLVFVGHGNTGVMTIGLGVTPVDKYDKITNRKHQETLDGLNLDNRMINVQNRETWGGQFTECRDCFAADRRDSTFHLIFAGCSTGNLSEISFKHLTKVAAKVLAPILNCTVNAYGTDNVIENDEIIYILEHIEVIKATATGGTGSIPIETDAGVNLDWFKRNP